MRKTLSIAATLLVAFGLTGCGKNPTGAPLREQKIKVTGNVKPVAVSAPGVSAKAAATAPRAVTAPAATVGVVAGAPAATEGSLAVTVSLSGTAAVASVKLVVADAADPEQAAEVTLPVVAGKASWNAAELPAGSYQVTVVALDASAKALGQGQALATVKAGAANQLKVDLAVNAAVAEATPAPTPAPTAAPTAAPTPTPAPVASPSPDEFIPLGNGGAIAVDVTITD